MSAGLAKALTGWTGTIKTTVAGSDAVVTPRDGDSVASLMCRLVERSVATFGGTWSLSTDASGVLTISSSTGFDLVATSNTQTRTAFTSTYTGTTTYTAAGAHASGYYPTYGLSAAPGLSTTTGGIVGDASGALYGVRVPSDQALTVWTTHSDAWTQESGDTTGVWDVWMDGRIYTRVHVGGWKRRAPGTLRSGMMRLDAVVTETLEHQQTVRTVPWSVGSWPTPGGYLYGYVDTSVPGYRLARDETNTTTVTVASGYYRADALVTALDTALSAQSFGASLTNGQAIVTTNGGDILVWPDRLGWVLGYGTEPGDEGASLRSGEDPYARYVAPCLIPYIGATWEEVDTSREIVVEVDRTMRVLPGVWGAGRVWRWTLTLDEYAYEALQLGWCLRGKVAIEGSESSALGGSQPDGALTGYALGLSGVRWLGPTRSHCEVDLLVASAVS